MKNKLGFGNKLLIQVLSTMIVVFGITMFFVIKYSYETSQSEAKEYLKEAASKEGIIVQGEVGKTILISKLMARKFESALKTGVPLNKKEVLQKFKDILDNNNLVVGVWYKVKQKGLFFPIDKTMTKKEGYDKTGQFNPYVTRMGDGTNLTAGAEYSGEQEWIKGPRESGKTYITKPYLYPVNGKKILMITVAVPIYNNDKFIGSAGVDISLETFSEKSIKTRYYDSGYFFLVDSYHHMIAHPNSKFLDVVVGKRNPSYLKAMKLARENKDTSFYATSLNTKKRTYYYSKAIVIGDGDFHWNLFLAVPVDEYLTNANFMRNFSIIATLIGLLLMSLVVFLSTKKLNYNLRSISTGLDGFFAYLNKQTDKTKAIELNSNDEFGAMAKSINENVTKIEEGINVDNQLLENVKDVVNHVGQGYLDKRIEKNTSTDSLNELKNLLNTMLENLESLVGKDLNKISEALSSYMKRDFTAKS